MINSAPYLREAIAALLNGNVSYTDSDGNVHQALVYDTEAPGTEDVYVIIGEYSDADQSNKNNFGSNASQVIEVVSHQHTGFKRIVDECGEGIMNAIHPNPQSNSLSNADFSIMVVGKPSINYIPEPDEEGIIMRLILRFQLLIQNN